MSDIRYEARTDATQGTGLRAVEGDLIGDMGVIGARDRLVALGYGFIANVGTGTTPLTFAGAYDANGPDFHLNVPFAVAVIPLSIRVVYDAVGTESTMEIIALASNTGDTSVTGTASTIYNLRTDGPRSSVCTATGAVDAAGVTDPNANNFFEFWRFARPLTDTVATGENDRLPLVFSWSAAEDEAPGIIVPHVDRGGALTVYAASQAGTGFITVKWLEVPREFITG